MLHGAIAELLNDAGDEFGITVDAEDEISASHHGLIFTLILGVEVLDLVHLAELSEDLKELISSTSLLRLEERKPENLNFRLGELSLNFAGEAIINDIFEIDRVKLISPWVQDLEALVIHILLPESLDILFDELEVSLVGFDGVRKIVLIDSLASVSQEAANSLDASRALQVLGSEELVELLFKRRAASIWAHLKSVKDAHEDLLETLEVPVLVDDGVNHS